MSSVQGIAINFAHYITDELNFDKRQGDVIRFGLEIILETLIKLTIVFTVAYLLGITPYVLAIFVTSISLRFVSGGAHFKTYWRCLTFGLITSVGLSYGSMLATPMLGGSGILFSTVAVAFIGFYFVGLWAPADNPSKPIKGQQKRQAYKRLSALYVALWVVTVILIIVTNKQSELITGICLASVGSFALQMISISPPSYRLAGLVDDYIDKLRVFRR